MEKTTIETHSPSEDFSSAASAHRRKFLRKIESRELKVGILGLGYVGLPLGLGVHDRGFQVLGFDVDPSKVDAIRTGDSYIQHLPKSRVAAALATGRFEATTDFARLGEPDALLICVPTPLDAHREPDLQYVRKTAEAIGPNLRAGQLICLESTTYPGTTDELLRSILDGSGLACGEDYFLAYSPERENPGDLEFHTTGIPKVVGGIGVAAGDMAEALYDACFSAAVRVSSTRVAEASKLTENIFRAVNIALVNELKVVYDAMGIDVWEVLDAAATKPFGFMRFNPGPGWGGHCIPIDPFYLSWKAREHGCRARFVELAGEVNVEMPKWVVGKLQRALNEEGRAVRGAKVLLLGVAYKADIGDPRESPAFEILDLLLDLGADVTYHDPHVPVAPTMRTWPDLPPLRSQPLTTETLAAQDAVLLVTDHQAVDYELVLESAPLVVDTRGVYRQATGDRLIRA
ncbi:MAG: nucleotide sugar dehydrogenase [Thermoanaerobaculia bacterium]|nr:nucleotide sugar dehydrogenase [Thermoanaerobaculia bacterium]